MCISQPYATKLYINLFLSLQKQSKLEIITVLLFSVFISGGKYGGASVFIILYMYAYVMFQYTFSVNKTVYMNCSKRRDYKIRRIYAYML